MNPYIVHNNWALTTITKPRSQGSLLPPGTRLYIHHPHSLDGLWQPRFHVFYFRACAAQWWIWVDPFLKLVPRSHSFLRLKVRSPFPLAVGDLGIFSFTPFFAHPFPPAAEPSLVRRAHKDAKDFRPILGRSLWVKDTAWRISRGG